MVVGVEEGCRCQSKLLSDEWNDVLRGFFFSTRNRVSISSMNLVM